MRKRGREGKKQLQLCSLQNLESALLRGHTFHIARRDALCSRLARNLVFGSQHRRTFRLISYTTTTVFEICHSLPCRCNHVACRMQPGQMAQLHRFGAAQRTRFLIRKSLQQDPSSVPTILGSCLQLLLKCCGIVILRHFRFRAIAAFPTNDMWQALWYLRLYQRCEAL